MKSKDSDYEVIITGSGVAGLTCGALLAKDGVKVLIVEKNPFVGGYCHSFKKEGFTFDLVSILLGCSEGGKIYKILKEIGAEKGLEFIRIKKYLTLHGIDDEVIEISSELIEVIENLTVMFPSDKEGIKGLFQTMDGIYKDLYIMPDSFISGLQFLSGNHLRKYGNKTYRELLDEFISNKRLKFILSSIAITFGGMTADMVSALYISNVIMTFFKEGGYLPIGGIQRLPDAVSKVFCHSGGTLIAGERVNKITIDKGMVTGIELSDGSVISTSCVVSNIDAHQTFFSLIGEKNLQDNYLEKLRLFRSSTSAFVVNLGLDLDIDNLPLSHMTLLLPAADPDELTFEVQRMINGNVSGFCIAHIPTLSDPSLAPEGKHVINLITLPSYDCNRNWTDEGNIISEKMICELERLIPKVSANIVHKSFLTPLTLEKYALNYKGACYGWSHTPAQFGMKRLQPKTPFKGLFLTGHWTVPGGGVTASMISGFMTSKIANEYLRNECGT
ncbi:MAG: Phytoene desaturase (lycopene-forming) [candidate division WS2 bacterium]|nr:Phytoene desaturase (lycopene-forming) [Candidatus Lithacetigena glycinireducens]